MSLLSTASPWTSDDSNRKRIPSLRKTVKLRPYTRDISEQAEEYQTVEGMTDVQNDNEDRSNRVNHILNQMSEVSPDNDGQGLVDFKPPPMPEMNMKKNIPSARVADEPIDPPTNSLQIPIPMIPKGSNPYYPSHQNLSNYQTVYQAPDTPYYNTIGLGNGNQSMESSSKLMDKINYMIHLLEGQENEKTANVTEEFILYTFLGVFMIYVVDSFSRGGKYVR